jgi:hypothetical protein
MEDRMTRGREADSRPHGARRWWLTAAIAGTTAAIVGGLAPAAQARTPAAQSSWHVVKTVSSSLKFLDAIAAPSGTSAWVLGTAATRIGSGPFFPAGLHWNGRTWATVTASSFPQAVRKTGIGCAGASSASNVWAFAGSAMFGNGASAAGALRLTNGHWKLMKTFPAGIVTNCLVLSPTQVWVFGDAHVAPGVGTWHLSGTTWTRVTTSGYVLASASAIRPSDIWAQGEDPYGNPVVAHWNGHSWFRNVKLSAFLPKNSSSLVVVADGLTALSDKDVLLRVMESNCLCGNPKFRRFVVVRWNGQAWSKVPTTDPAYHLAGATSDGHGGWWAEPPASPRVMLHLVSGHWVRVALGTANCPTPQPFVLTAVGGTADMLGLQDCSGTGISWHQNVIVYGHLP